MAKPLPQTKRLSDALRSAGFKRGEFSVRSPFDKKVQGYLNTHIVLLREPTQSELRALDASRQFDIEVLTWDGKCRTCVQPGSGRFMVSRV